MPQELRERLNLNLARVDNLVTVYKKLGGPGAGRRPLQIAVEVATREPRGKMSR